MNTHASLTSLLTRQQEHLSVLFSLLQLELKAISQRDVQALEQNTQQKMTLLDTVQQLDLQIANHSELARAKQTSEFREHMSAVDALLAQCKEQNEVNRLAVEQSQLVIERYKHELLQQRGKSGLTYNAKGKPALDSHGKSIKA